MCTNGVLHGFNLRLQSAPRFDCPRIKPVCGVSSQDGVWCLFVEVIVSSLLCILAFGHDDKRMQNMNVQERTMTGSPWHLKLHFCTTATQLKETGVCLSLSSL